jgi:F-box and leucine-rich repeat protein 1 (S-phase kinase-associated protein 2)
MNNLALSLAPKFTKLQTPILRQDKPQLEGNAVEAVAKFYRDLQILDLSKSFKLSLPIVRCMLLPLVVVILQN